MREPTSSCIEPWSPSTRREWIEISLMRLSAVALCTSPSTRREWIEIGGGYTPPDVVIRLPPLGGSGLKCSYSKETIGLPSLSPSTRREWIEIVRCY